MKYKLYFYTSYCVKVMESEIGMCDLHETQNESLSKEWFDAIIPVCNKLNIEVSQDNKYNKNNNYKTPIESKIGYYTYEHPAFPGIESGRMIKELIYTIRLHIHGGDVKYLYCRIFRYERSNIFHNAHYEVRFILYTQRHINIINNLQ